MKVEYDCVVCGIHVTKIRTPGNMKSPPKYCSQKCHGIDKHNNKTGTMSNIEYHCLNCGKTVRTYRSPSSVKLFTPKFCSLSCLGEYQRGMNNPAWAGGKHLQAGYYVVWIPDHPYADCKGYVYEHRLVMEQIIGRFLRPEEVVHHIDKNKTNNAPDNLMLFKDQSVHIKYHNQEKANG